MDEPVNTAFFEVCRAARPPQGHYVVLMHKTERYGGPEEGGWWVEDHLVEAYQYFATEEAAQAAYEAVRALAADLTRQALVAHGEHCLREMDWLDARGLEADYLPEPDGPGDYYVTLTDEVPASSYAPRHYE